MSVSGTPLSRASTVIGAPGLTLSPTGSLVVGGAIGRACGALSRVAESRNSGGIAARSEV